LDVRAIALSLPAGATTIPRARRIIVAGEDLSLEAGAATGVGNGSFSDGDGRRATGDEGSSRQEGSDTAVSTTRHENLLCHGQS
jgi:hypothetical protein